MVSCIWGRADIRHGGFVCLCEMHDDGVGGCLTVSSVFPRGSAGACLWARGAALGILFRGGPFRSHWILDPFY